MAAPSHSIPAEPAMASSEGGESKLHALKPLEELSDADIRQLTREDCRRYLKERGMRRPSWNKAQAIQQVLSLRSLMCSSTKPVPSSVESESVPGPFSKQFPDKQSTPHFTAPNTTCRPRVAPGAPEAAQHSVFKTRITNAPVRPALQPQHKPHRAQLTIFYSGLVKVYEDVSLEKAQAIMLLAASKTIQVPAAGQTPSPSTSSLSLHAAGLHVNAPPAFPAGAIAPFPATSASLNHPQHQHQEEGTDPGGGLPQARTISLQRFLAKRRERISANQSFYRRGEKQPGTGINNNKRSKPSSSPPPPAFPLPRRSPPAASNNNHTPHTRSINNRSDGFSSTSSENTTTSSATNLSGAATPKNKRISGLNNNLIGGTF